MPPQPKPPKQPAQSPPRLIDPGFRVTTTNENWRGKNDPAERRRIQNRINQRAFRERQRSGETIKEYSPRGKSAASESPDARQKPNDNGKNDDDEKDEGEDEGKGNGCNEGEDDEDDQEESEDEDESESESESDDDEDDDDEEEEEAEQSNHGSPPPAAPTRPHFTGQVSRAACTPSIPSTDNPWDELAQLINRNFMQAAATNAQHLGLNLTSLRSGAPACTPRLRNVANLPPTLKPIEVQHQLPHDPIIDTIPHSRLRFNIVRAIATGNLDASRFSASLRRSGAVLNVQGEARRSGLIVWNFPEQLSSWELSEAFFIIWGFLLEGCEDFVAVTNVWRSRRGEKSLVLGARTVER